ncbi:MAG TPA: alanine dehydrogenase [Myxococcota bacterium]|nr:alanine dehydrogenase [Myxococcota bacterium]HQK50195.1 alanine dehydrogenase [Myxococcota bacterium]
MTIGVAREVRYQEYRVGLTPSGAARLVGLGHTVLVASGAGVGAGFPDDEYVARGARILRLNEDLYGEADLVVKFHAPTEAECPFLREGQILFCSLHLATMPDLARALLDQGVTAIAYETVTRPDGRMPIVRPMSEIAGKMAVQVGASLLQKSQGGRGVLLGGVTGVDPGVVTILGAGTVGVHAARVAEGMNARVFLLDNDLDRLRQADEVFLGRVNTLFADADAIERQVIASDLVIGAVQEPGRRAPVLVPESLVARMVPGAVIVDVAIDQGGCVETMRPTTHGHPTFVVHDVVHYGVPNMPGAVPRTSTLALTQVTVGYLERIARLGLEEAVRTDTSLAAGINTHRGRMVHPVVADALGIQVTPIQDLFG